MNDTKLRHEKGKYFQQLAHASLGIVKKHSPDSAPFILLNRMMINGVTPPVAVSLVKSPRYIETRTKRKPSCSETSLLAQLDLITWNRICFWDRKITFSLTHSAFFLHSNEMRAVIKRRLWNWFCLENFSLKGFLFFYFLSLLFFLLPCSVWTTLLTYQRKTFAWMFAFFMAKGLSCNRSFLDWGKGAKRLKSVILPVKGTCASTLATKKKNVFRTRVMKGNTVMFRL